MKLITFTYTKADGSTSKREVIETHQPTKLMSGIDVSEMEATDFAEFANDYKEMLDRQKEEYLKLMTTYDLKHAYRQFKVEGMTEVVTEHV